MLNPNKVFFRMVAGIIVMALVKLEVIDVHQQETFTDVMTMFFTGLGLFMYAVYEVWHLFLHKPKHVEGEIVVENNKFYVKFFNWFKTKAFVSETATPPTPQQ